MIHHYTQQLVLLVKRLLICYFVYFVCRIVFYTANKNDFPETDFSELLELCLAGLRFDTFSIFVANALFILLSILPINLFSKSVFQKLLFWVFIVFNSVFLSTNCIDLVYYRFTKKRSSYDLFEQIGGQSDLARLLPQFIIDFWWAFLFFGIMVYTMVLLYKRVKIASMVVYTTKPLKHWLGIGFLFLFSSGLTVLGIRGGLQRVPIDIIDAGSVAKPEEVPIVLNTPFTLIKSTSQISIKEYTFYAADELGKFYNPIHQFDSVITEKQNLVVIILESFAKEYTKLGKQKSITPFLDSLIDHSLTFNNAYSNGNKSIEGIPAILSSLPTLIENPLINSLYANNKQSSLAVLLKKEGYHSAFFHGGINGTMNFDDWAVLAGYDAYYGRNEYNNDEDFDNFWGIWDEPFLKYTVSTMDKFKQPFHSAIFTLSSHHPFFIPKKFKGKFPKTSLENSESIAYADYALREFFKAAQKTDWYKNTLFVLTADHSSLSEHPFYRSTIGNLAIPILFFKPDNSLAGQNSRVFSQIDILPSSLYLLGYQKPFFAFGESFSGKKNKLSYYYSNSNYYVINDSMAFQFNKDELLGVYNFKRDSSLQQNIITKHSGIETEIINHYKAFLQTYNATLIHNTGILK